MKLFRRTGRNFHAYFLMVAVLVAACSKPEESLGSLQQRASAGDVVAAYQLGTRLLQMNRTNEAVDSIRKAADQNHPAAQFHMGELYRFGIGVPQDFKLGREWYLKAAAHDYPAAVFELGQVFHYGVEAPADKAAAMALYLKAQTLGARPPKDRFELLANGMTEQEMAEANALATNAGALLLRIESS